jgi:uncharacterized protein (DUF1697 family)
VARYVVLLRGINVGGKNRVPMAELRDCLEQLGFTDVVTYIASGNVILSSRAGAREIKERIEAALPERFPLDSDLVRVLVLPRTKFRAVVEGAPDGFGTKPDTFHSDAIFLMEITAKEAMTVFHPREGVDEVTAGRGVIYSQRLSAQRTRSRLGKIVGTEPYRSMTIRSWSTVTKLLGMLDG